MDKWNLRIGRRDKNKIRGWEKGNIGRYQNGQK